jgi:hypothetical protein
MDIAFLGAGLLLALMTALAAWGCERLAGRAAPTKAVSAANGRSA